MYCQKPFDEWVEPAKDGDVSLVVGIEAAGWEGHHQPVQLCQWVFGAAAGHQILGRAIDLVVYRQDAAWPPCMPTLPCCMHQHAEPQHVCNVLPHAISTTAEDLGLHAGRFHVKMAYKAAGHVGAAGGRRFLSDRRWVNPEAFQPRVLRTTGPVLFTLAVEEFLEDRRAGSFRPLLLALKESPACTQLMHVEASERAQHAPCSCTRAIPP